MIIDQVSVFLENRAGTMEGLVETIGKAGINISALSVAETAEFGIVRMIVSDTEKCVDTLRAADYQVKTGKVIQVETPDEPGALAEQLKKFKSGNVSVKYMYGYSNAGIAYLIIKVDEPEKAITLLS